MVSLLFLVVSRAIQLNAVLMGDCPEKTMKSKGGKTVSGCPVNAGVYLTTSGNGDIIIHFTTFKKFTNTVLNWHRPMALSYCQKYGHH
jgi:hypothetical protein